MQEATANFLAAVKVAYEQLPGGQQNSVLAVITRMLDDLCNDDRGQIAREQMLSGRALMDPPSHRAMRGRSLFDICDKVLLPQILKEIIMEDAEVSALEMWHMVDDPNIPRPC